MSGHRFTARARRIVGSARVGYLLAGGVSLSLDLASLFCLHGLLGLPLVPSTTIAYLVGLSTNYGINRVWVFNGGDFLGRSAGRYGLLVAFNYAATIMVVSSLTHAGASYIVAKVVAIAATVVWNFLAYRHWVFTPRVVERQPPPSPK